MEEVSLKVWDRPSEPPNLYFFFAHDTQRRHRNGRIHRLTTRTCKNYTVLKIGTINIATLHKKEEEVVTLMKERNLDVLGLCETRREGTGNMTIHDNYKLVWSGLPQDKRRRGDSYD